MESRLERLEDNLVIGEERQQHVRDLTIQANMARVPTLVLIELVLSNLEQVVFPGEESRRPDFVDNELLRPVSEEDLARAAKGSAWHAFPEENDAEAATQQACRLVADFAAKVSTYTGKSDGYVPIGYCYPGWDVQVFLDRWELVKEVFGYDRQERTSPTGDEPK